LNAKGRIALGDATRLTLVATSLRQPDTQDPLGLTAAQVAQNPRQVVTQAIQFNTRKTIDHDQTGMTLDHAFSAQNRMQVSAWYGTRFVEQYLAIPLATQNANLVAGANTHSGGVVDLDRNFGGGALRFFSEHRQGYINNLGVKGALKRDEDNVVDSTGLYAQAEWLFAERWSAHAGVRSTQVSFQSTDHFITANPANGDDSGAKDYGATTPVAGLLYRLDTVTSLYANYGRGFETPTFVELAYRNSGAGLNLDLEAAESSHFEVGAKLLREGAYRANVALFDIETKNEIVTDQSSGGRTTYRNAGRTQRRGLEIAAESLVSGPFELRAAYTYLDAVFADGFATVTGTPAVPATVAPGNVLPGVPKNQLYAEAAWRYAPAGLRVATEFLYRSKVAVNDINSEFAAAYGIINLVFGLQQQGARWRVSEFLRVDNATDKAYVGSVVVNDANGRYYEPAPQRSTMVGVQANLQF